MSRLSNLPIETCEIIYEPNTPIPNSHITIKPTSYGQIIIPNLPQAISISTPPKSYLSDPVPDLPNLKHFKIGSISGPIPPLPATLETLYIENFQCNGVPDLTIFPNLTHLIIKQAYCKHIPINLDLFPKLVSLKTLNYGLFEVTYSKPHECIQELHVGNKNFKIEGSMFPNLKKLKCDELLSGNFDGLEGLEILYVNEFEYKNRQDKILNEILTGNLKEFGIRNVNTVIENMNKVEILHLYSPQGEINMERFPCLKIFTLYAREKEIVVDHDGLDKLQISGRLWDEVNVKIKSGDKINECNLYDVGKVEFCKEMNEVISLVCKMETVEGKKDDGNGYSIIDLNKFGKLKNLEIKGMCKIVGKCDSLESIVTDDFRYDTDLSLCENLKRIKVYSGKLTGKVVLGKNVEKLEMRVDRKTGDKKEMKSKIVKAHRERVKIEWM